MAQKIAPLGSQTNSARVLKFKGTASTTVPSEQAFTRQELPVISFCNIYIANQAGEIVRVFSDDLLLHVAHTQKMNTSTHDESNLAHWECLKAQHASLWRYRRDRPFCIGLAQNFSHETTRIQGLLFAMPPA